MTIDVSMLFFEFFRRFVFALQLNRSACAPLTARTEWSARCITIPLFWSKLEDCPMDICLSQTNIKFNFLSKERFPLLESKLFASLLTHISLFDCTKNIWAMLLCHATHAMASKSRASIFNRTVAYINNEIEKNLFSHRRQIKRNELKVHYSRRCKCLMNSIGSNTIWNISFESEYQYNKTILFDIRFNLNYEVWNPIPFLFEFIKFFGNGISIFAFVFAMWISIFGERSKF